MQGIQICITVRAENLMGRQINMPIQKFKFDGTIPLLMLIVCPAVTVF